MRRCRYALWAVLPWILVGCQEAGPTAGSDPAATFAAFDSAMKSGDYAGAAALVNYERAAAKENEDWDNIPQGQRTQILTKMQEDTANGLRRLNYPSTGLAAAAAQGTGDQATVTATGGGQTLTLQMAKIGATWQITGGVPGMLTEDTMAPAASAP
ncbi:MAG: hypothetical protein IT204_13505 [Fimbriimonadaceae bacterium]|nr:hypothetical protein [Fimbriimonadaceae bacterium]